MFWLGILVAISIWIASSYSDIVITLDNAGRWIIIGYLIIVLLAFSPTIYAKTPRFLKDAQRFSSGILGILGVYLVVNGEVIFGISIIATMIAALFIYYRKRRVRKLMQCNDCPELSDEKVCIGFEIQAAHIRRFEQEATEYIEKISPYPPKMYD